MDAREWFVVGARACAGAWKSGLSMSVPWHNKQLQRTVTRRHMRAASASFHCAHAARWLGQRAAAELRR